MSVCGSSGTQTCREGAGGLGGVIGWGSLAWSWLAGVDETSTWSHVSLRTPLPAAPRVLGPTLRMCHVFKVTCLALGTQHAYSPRVGCAVLQRCVCARLRGPCHRAGTEPHHWE